MFNLPENFVVFDLEWTAWEGSRERNWSGPDEHREVYDIGAAFVSGPSFEVKDTFRRLVTLEIVPSLPTYSSKLTGISQEDIDREGIPFSQAIEEFDAFTQGADLYNWGTGDPVAIAESCQLKNIKNPFEGRVHDIRPVFSSRGIPTDTYMSSTIVEAFGKKNERVSHQGLDDALNIVEGLRLLQEVK